MKPKPNAGARVLLKMTNVLIDMPSFYMTCYSLDRAFLLFGLITTRYPTFDARGSSGIALPSSTCWIECLRALRFHTLSTFSLLMLFDSLSIGAALHERRS